MYKENSTIDHQPVLVSAFAPPGITVIRSWLQLGIQPAVIWLIPERERATKLYNSQKQMHIKTKDFFSNNGIDKISIFLLKANADSIICINEKATLFLLENKDRLPTNLRILSSGIDRTVSLLCKKTQIEVAKRIGFNVLPTYFLGKDNQNEVQDIPLELYPLCLRPSEPGTTAPGFKVEMVYTLRDFQKLLSKHVIKKGAIIAQPFKSLSNLVIHGSRDKTGKHFGIQAFIVNRKFEGVTLSIYPTDIEPALAKQCNQFVDEFNLIGNYHFEFLYDPKTCKSFFLEINARFGGTTAKIFASGYDEPAYALMAYGLDAKPNISKLKKKTISSKTALIKYLLNTLKNQITPLDYPEEPKAIRLLKTVWGLLFYKDDIFSWQDLRGSWELYRHNIRAKIKR